MRTQSIDTSPEAERIQIMLLRKRGTQKRFQLATSVSNSTLASTHIYLRRQYPGITEQDAMFLSAEHTMGQALVNELRQTSERRQIFPAFSTIDMQSALFPVLRTLEHAGIACALTGPLACCLYGMQQAVKRIDILADLEGVDVAFLHEFLPATFYVRLADIQTALVAKTAILYYHLPSLFTVRIIFPQARLDELAMLKHARRMVLVENEATLPVVTPEDIALLTIDRVLRREAELAQQGRKEQADDIWNELLGVLKVQGSDLDIPFIEQQALRFGLLSAMQQAFEDAGLRE